ncbi:MAG: flagellar hook-basal body complex protein FliE [Synergistaceae bacterium]|jgi:flagellar hook-basal body complex protein FliE|nr:flagellar hook-basal body complex protein FliE [Synergistaceae bacterium]
MDPVMVDMSKLMEVKMEVKNDKTERLRSSVSVSSGKNEVTFEELLSSSMKEVNDLQLESDAMVQKLATGDVEDISEVVMASSRAEVALRMFMELRNKFVDAYQQLSRMSA